MSVLSNSSMIGKSIKLLLAVLLHVYHCNFCTESYPCSSFVFASDTTDLRFLEEKKDDEYCSKIFEATTTAPAGCPEWCHTPIGGSFSAKPLWYNVNYYQDKDTSAYPRQRDYSATDAIQEYAFPAAYTAVQRAAVATQVKADCYADTNCIGFTYEGDGHADYSIVCSSGKTDSEVCENYPYMPFGTQCSKADTSPCGETGGKYTTRRGPLRYYRLPTGQGRTNSFIGKNCKTDKFLCTNAVRDSHGRMVNANGNCGNEITDWNNAEVPCVDQTTGAYRMCKIDQRKFDRFYFDLAELGGINPSPGQGGAPR